MRGLSAVLSLLIAASSSFALDFHFVDQSNPTPASERAVPDVQDQGYRVLANERVKGYSVRIKEPKSCEQGVQYSGYIDNIETDDHFFFYFFESRRDPANDPLVLWLNGGPGCSSMMGLWMELGPCLVSDGGNSTVRNPYSWNEVANVVFLDQPVNVGYSYGKSKIRTSKDSARDVYAFLQLFLDEFKQYADNPFHISGESYGGHYLPALAAEILHQNKLVEKSGHLPLKFESMLIGNGWTEPRTQYKGYEEYSCANDSAYKPLFDEQECAHMRETYPRCKALATLCYNYPSAVTCVPASLYCQKTQQENFGKTGLNPYDIRRPCAGDSGLCYDEIDWIETYANQPEVRAALGVDYEAGNYTGCDDSVGYRFALTGDGNKDHSPFVAQALEEGVRVLLYVGDMDWICNWVGNLAWSLEMKWSGQEEYRASKEEEWHNKATGAAAGLVRRAGNLTFARVFDAGHMVPYDQPENALDMFARWLENELFVSN